MRRYGLDWLRVFVILLLFPFHTARVFDAWEPNYVKDAVNGFSSWFVAALGYWFMPLMFFIAGYAACCALSRRTPGQYVRERVMRLLIPFLFGMVVIVPPQAYIARLQAGYDGGYFAFLAGYVRDFHDLSGYTGGFTPAHLWFILYLFVIGTALTPLLTALVKKGAGLGTLAAPAPILLGFIPITLMEALPDIGGKNPFFYAMYFALGAVMATSQGFMETIGRMRLPMLATGAAAGAGMLLVGVGAGWPSGFSLPSIGFAFWRNLSAWLLVLSLTAYADRYLNRPGPLLAYLSRASYPLYLVHQTLLVVVAYFVVALAMPPAGKFILIMTGTLAASLALYELCRRFGPTRLLLGIK